MSQTLPDAQRLAKLRKMAQAISLNFWLGVLGVILCFFAKTSNRNRTSTTPTSG